MAGNSFGTLFRITTFGESHGPYIGVVIDGCYPGVKLNTEAITLELSKRRPGQSELTTARKEDDIPEIISGLYDGKTTGAPLTILIRNKDQRPADYNSLQHTYRPSHADYTYQAKYGIRDHRGSGRASARETAARVAAGAVALQLLEARGIAVHAFVSKIGNVSIPETAYPVNLSLVEQNVVRCPHESTATAMQKLIADCKEQGDTLGGVINGLIQFLPPGLGEPVFDKFHARLGYAMLGINAVKGFEIGSGFDGVAQKGSQQNDVFSYSPDGKVTTLTNHSGGVQGGITNGMDITFRVAFKPVSTLMKSQKSIDVDGNEVVLHPGGRHDVCVVPRAVPIVRAMAAITALDFVMQQDALNGNFQNKNS